MDILYVNYYNHGYGSKLEVLYGKFNIVLLQIMHRKMITDLYNY
jgi:hypothetical protein